MRPWLLMLVVCGSAGLAAQVRAGTSFETLASQQSTDRNSAIDGGALGCIDGQQLAQTREAPL